MLNFENQKHSDLMDLYEKRFQEALQCKAFVVALDWLKKMQFINIYAWEIDVISRHEFYNMKDYLNDLENEYWNDRHEMENERKMKWRR